MDHIDLQRRRPLLSDRVCERVQSKIDTWEERFGRPYPQGPGQALTYGSLETERAAVQQIADTLRSARAKWGASEQIFEADLDNRTRLRRFDVARARVPERELQAVRCEAVALPQAPPDDLFGRDDALSEETPVYAFEDLALIFSPAHTFTRGDYPTVFAFFLAIFIDLFALLVAIGAAVVEETEPRRPSLTTQPGAPAWAMRSPERSPLGLTAPAARTSGYRRTPRICRRPDRRASFRLRQQAPVRGHRRARAAVRLPDGQRVGGDTVAGCGKRRANCRLPAGGRVYPALTRYLAAESRGPQTAGQEAR